MSTSFRRRPSPFVAQKNMMFNKQKEPKTETVSEPEKDKPDNGFKLYPLTPGENPKTSRQNQGVRTVQPLSQTGFNQPQQMQQQQMQQPRGHMRQQQNGLNPMRQMQQQGINPMQQQPQGLQAAHPYQSPQSPPPPQKPIPPEKAADQFRRINNGLPDGVRYEPLDEETMRLLRDNGHMPTLSQQSANQPSTSPPQPSKTTPQQPTTPNQILQQQQSEAIQPTPTNQLSSLSPARTPMIPPESLSLSTPPQPSKSQSQSPEKSPSPSPISLSGSIPLTLEALAQDERNAQIFYSSIAENSNNEKTKTLLTTLSADCEIRLRLYSTLLTNHCNRIFTPLETEINTNVTITEALTLALAEENKGLITLSTLLDQVSDTPAEAPIQRILHKKVVGHQLLASLQFTSGNL